MRKAVAFTSSFSILINADFKPEQIRIVSFVAMISERNDRVEIFNHWDSFVPDISATILKCNYAFFFGEE